MLLEGRIRNFRCISDIQVLFQAGINGIRGENGSGKTSLLEALSICANGKSFRTNMLRECVQKGAEGFSVSVQNSDNILQSFLFTNNQRKLLIGEHKPEKLSQYININTIITISPEDLELVSYGSSARRKFIDRGIFEHYPHYLATLSYYQRILKNRNALLRQQDHSTLPYWNDLLADYALEIHQQRMAYTDSLSTAISTISNSIEYPRSIDIVYAGSSDDIYRNKKGFLEYLESKYSDEKRYGYTLAGPHKAELKIQIGNLAVGKYASYGQQKLVAIIMKLAQCSLIRNLNKEPILFIDDIAGGLDTATLKKVSTLLRSYQQVLLTTIHGERLPLDFCNIIDI